MTVGEWVERYPGYLSYEVYNCTYCGKMIPRHIWYENLEGERLPFCGPDCARRRQERLAKTAQQPTPAAPAKPG